MKNKRTIIIAEAGVNHNGSMDLAYKLIDAASEAGADYVKFQTFQTDLIVDKSAKKAEYQIDASSKEESQFDMIKKLELSYDDFEQLRLYCGQKNIKFCTTAADLKSLEVVSNFNMDFIKISSGELTNALFLKKVSEIGKPVILSTGMADLSEIEYAISLLSSGVLERHEITVLHCNTEYPTPFSDVNLQAMKTIGDAFKVPIGYSDHTLGIEVPIAAVAMGATVIEKHFTLDKSMEGPDHAASLDPIELKEMCEAIRNVEKAISGSGVKEPSNSERKNIEIVRKSIFSFTPIRKGEVFTENNIIGKRPGNGISMNQVFSILGKKAARDIEEGEKLEGSDIVW